MGRPKKALLSADRIADAAMALVDAGEPFGVNAVARALGVTPSSLYHHVSGRDEIIELMRGRLIDRHPLGDEGGDWEHVVTTAVRTQRHTYGEHPFLLPLIVGKTVTDPMIIAWYDRLASALSSAGFPDDDVLPVIALIDAFALGFGLDVASPEVVWEPGTTAKTLSRALSASPTGRARSDRAFEAGLEVLLDGLRARLVRAHAATRSSAAV